MAVAVAAAAVVAGTAVVHADVEPKIIGGHEATGDTQWMVSVQYDAPAHGRYDFHTCAGVLSVARDAVLSAAHCFQNPPAAVTAEAPARWNMDAETLAIPAQDKVFKVRIESKDWTTGGDVVPVASISVHPDWNWGQDLTKPFADLAVLRLERPMDYQPIQIASKPARPGERAVLYGWGADSPASTGTLPRRLQQLDTKVATPQRCADAQFSALEVCFENPNGVDGACYGDSGSPTARYTRQGVPQLIAGTSRGAGVLCSVSPFVGPDYPAYRDWIYEQVRGGPASEAPEKAPVPAQPGGRP